MIKKIYPWRRNNPKVSEETQPSVKPCTVCGGTKFNRRKILWPELIEAWELDPTEVQLIDNQQGVYCLQCGSNLRSMTLAGAFNKHFGWAGTLSDLCVSGKLSKTHILEINEAGSLTPYLSRCRNHVLTRYPQIDIQKIDMTDATFDVVIHSDTLEHIQDPVHALKECKRVLRPMGVMMMTIPIVPTRLSRIRKNLEPSYHGTPSEKAPDFLVHTEYGADFYVDMIRAGWFDIRIFTLGTIDSLALIGIKEP